MNPCNDLCRHYATIKGASQTQDKYYCRCCERWILFEGTYFAELRRLRCRCCKAMVRRKTNQHRMTLPVGHEGVVIFVKNNLNIKRY